ncbi:MAG: GNAT family N-acetyltransferase [Anaerolineales bacterium]|nr:GNAT family N-acetyltransferase [Anaerolineales bacterium]
MQLSILRDTQPWQTMADEWNALLKDSASHVPFLRHEYLFSWWTNLGGGEWYTGELYIIVGRDEDGQLVGIAPFFLTQTDDKKSTLMLLGSHEISDYLDIIARPADLPAFIEAIFDHLDSPEAPAWQILDIYNVFESSPSTPLLKQAASHKGWECSSFSREDMQHCPIVALPGDWDTYLADIDKKQRHEIRRKIRRAQESEVAVRWYIVQDEDLLDNGIEELFRLMAQDDAKRAFLTEAMRQQMRAIIKIAFEHGWLQLAFLEVGGEKAAVYLNFDYDNRIWVYNSGIDTNFGAYSPGWVLVSYLLQWANEHGRQAFDFMRGSEDYKYRFGGVDRFIIRVKIERMNR